MKTPDLYHRSAVTYPSKYEIGTSTIFKHFIMTKFINLCRVDISCPGVGKNATEEKVKINCS